MYIYTYIYIPLSIHISNQDSIDENDADMQTYEYEVDEQGEWRLLHLKSHHGPLHAQESGTFRTPDFDRSLLPNGGNVKGLRVQLQVPHRYWQMWYPEKGSKCFSWGDSTKETYAGSLQKDAFLAGVAWLHATHTKKVGAKPCVPKPLAPQLQIANASLAIGNPSMAVPPATLGDPTPLDQTLLASRLHPQPSTTSTPATRPPRRSVNAGAMPSLIIGDAMTDKSLTMDGQRTQEDAKRVGEHTLGSMSAAAESFVSQILQRHGCGAGPSEALREQPVR